MIKFVLVLYSCSFMTMQCGHGTYLTQHNSWYECDKQGYIESHRMMEIADRNEVNANKLAVKFECKPIETILPKPKPQV